MYHNLEELKLLIASKLSVEEILDILEWDMYGLVEALEEHIRDNMEDFEEAVSDN